MKKLLFILSVCLLAFVSCSDPNKNLPHELTDAEILEKMDPDYDGWYHYDVTVGELKTYTVLKFYTEDTDGHRKGDVERAGSGNLQEEYTGSAFDTCKSTMTFVMCYKASQNENVDFWGCGKPFWFE